MNVIALAAVTVDGKISRSDTELVNWTSKEDKQFFAQTTKEAGVIVLGKKTFDTFSKPLPGRLHIVLTKHPEVHANIEGVVEYTNKTTREILDMLGKRGFETVIIAGGAQIYTLFLKEKCLDEVWLTIEPKIFGTGVPLFTEELQTLLNLIEYKQLTENVLLVKYKVSNS